MKLDDERGLLEHFAHDFPLDADTPSMNDARHRKSPGMGFVKIRDNGRLYITRRKGV
jgi:hypothetical protein